NGLVIHFGDLAGDQVGGHHALFLALVRQHRATHHVANGPYIGRVGLAVVIDLDEAALVDLHAGAFAEQVLGERTTADGDHHLVDFQGLLTLGVGVLERHALGGLVGATDLRAQANVQA